MIGTPPDLLAALGALGAVPERWRREGQRVYCWAGEFFARFSDNAADEARFSFEREARAAVHAARSELLRAPEVVAHGPGWMIEARVVPGPPVMADIARAATEIAELTLPQRASSSDESRLHALQRRLAVLATPLVRDVLSARAILRSSPLPRVTSHGDFHPNNVYASDGAVWVFDWELAGCAPVGADALRYWCTVESPAQRDCLFDAIVSSVGQEHRGEMLRLRYATVVRTLVGARSNRRAFDRNDDLARRLAALLPELRRDAFSSA